MLSRRVAATQPLSWLWLLGLLLCVRSATAGGGPENVFLVVNSRDQDSLTIANHFAAIRQVPDRLIFYLPWEGPEFETDIATFRAALLQPILDQIEQRQISDQIDYIVYSSGYPYAVDFSAELDRDAESPVASLTGLTTLYQYVLEESLLFRSLSANRYASASVLGTPTHGFRARYGLDHLGRRVKSESALGRRYYLSMMLGYTGGPRSNTVDEILRYLSLAADADGDLPTGTIYYVQNDTPRSTPRNPAYPAAVAELAKLGVKAEILQGSIPGWKNDVQGCMVGFRRFDWERSGSKILPGAICDNLTSFGGVMKGKHSQALLSDFLRAGAAASCGTVVEPRNYPQKFPHPLMHVHYARGCSIAEAFYQSVAGPYQLLIVGDPLCQPWARPPRVQVDGLEPYQQIAGDVSLTAWVDSATGNKIRYLQVFVDGQLATYGAPNTPIPFDSTKLADGYHELRVVAVEDSPIETQGRAVVPFVSINQNRNLISEVSPSGRLAPHQAATVRVQSEDSREIRLYRGRELLGKLEGSQGQIPLDVGRLGNGQVTLQAVGIPTDDELLPVFGLPLTVEVQGP